MQWSCNVWVISQRGKHRLSCLKIGDSFLTLPPEKYMENENYRHGRDKIYQLILVVSCVELLNDLKGIINNDE
jgi:hypothetical protein